MKVAPPFSSGGGGSDFEKRVACLLICSAVSGVAMPPFKAPLNKLWLQAGHLGCSIEDIVFEVTENSESRRFFCTAKTTIAPLSGNPEFKEVISRAWIDWNNSEVFNQSADHFALFASTTRSTKIIDFLRLTEIARASDNQDDFSNRTSIPRYHRKSIQDITHSISAIINEITGEQPNEENIWRFISSIYVLSFDLDTETSQDKQRTLGLLQLANKNQLPNAAKDCWNTIFEMVSEEVSRAKVIRIEDVFEKIEQYEISPNLLNHAHKWLQKIREHSTFNKNSISRTVGGQHLQRKKIKEQLRHALTTNNNIIVSGSPGCGKSSITIEAAEEIFSPDNVYCFHSDQFNYPHLDTALEAAGLSQISPSQWTDATSFEEKVIIVDSVERMFQSQSSFTALRVIKLGRARVL